ncbi:Hypothetical predicted protein, partial [Mytilus galloprovincialis]
HEETILAVKDESTELGKIIPDLDISKNAKWTKNEKDIQGTQPVLTKFKIDKVSFGHEGLYVCKFGTENMQLRYRLIVAGGIAGMEPRIKISMAFFWIGIFSTTVKSVELAGGWTTGRLAIKKDGGLDADDGGLGADDGGLNADDGGLGTDDGGFGADDGGLGTECRLVGWCEWRVGLCHDGFVLGD